jgi:hypothetical protein
MDLKLAENEWPGRGVGVPPLAPFSGARWRTEKKAALQALDEPLAAGLLGVGRVGNIVDEP